MCTRQEATTTGRASDRCDEVSLPFGGRPAGSEGKEREINRSQ